jgi:60 kDa SS-A/Ro ribonucleoprotein
MNYVNEIISTPQSVVLPGQVKNNAGGAAFQISARERLRRFLVLGTEGGPYYTAQKALTVENAANIIALIKNWSPNDLSPVAIIAEISQSGVAPKNSPAIFALALCATYGDAKIKAQAYGAIHLVCRTGTHLFEFVDCVNKLRGWSRGLRNGVAKYYLRQKPDDLGYQLIKYRQRNGWTHRDVLRLAHVKAHHKPTDLLLKYAVGKLDGLNENFNSLPCNVRYYDALCRDGDILGSAAKLELIRLGRLPWEALPTQILNDKQVCEYLNETMPYTALVRNLARMTANGFYSLNFDDSVKIVCDRLTDQAAIEKSKIHPVNLLNAFATYHSGHGLKGSLTWTPVTKILEALDAAFYLSFKAVVPSGKNIVVGLDVSGSMGFGNIAGMAITPRAAAAAMCMALVRTEPNVEVMAFGDTFRSFPISRLDNLNSICKRMNNMSFGSTDCALPMKWALQNKVNADAFAIYTDNETWYGDIHPHQALWLMRHATGKNQKLAVLGMTATDFTIADPSDKGMLDVVGLDSSAPQLVSDFFAERV